MDIERFSESLESLSASFSNISDKKQIQGFAEKLMHLLEDMESLDSESLEKAIKNFEKKRNPVFDEIGKVLRRFHDELSLIRDKIPENIGKISNYDVADMTEKLQHIITMTDKAANTTLDLTEELMDEISKQDDFFKNKIDQIDNLLTQEHSKEIQDILQETKTGLEEQSANSLSIQDKLTQILLAQDYQDLTSQVIQKILKLIQTLEEDLISLIRKFGIPTPTIEEKKEEDLLKGPLTENHAEKSSQDDVNDLLSQFGF